MEAALILGAAEDCFHRYQLPCWTRLQAEAFQKPFTPALHLLTDTLTICPLVWALVRLDGSTIAEFLGICHPSGMQIEAESLLFRSLGFAMNGLITIFLICVSAYFFTQVPVRLWEIAAAVFIGGLMLRLLSRVAHHESAAPRDPVVRR
jgi:hypothetical protein